MNGVLRAQNFDRGYRREAQSRPGLCGNGDKVLDGRTFSIGRVENLNAGPFQFGEIGKALGRVCSASEEFRQHVTQMTHRRPPRRKRLKISLDNLVKFVWAEESGYAREVFAQDIAKPQKVGVRVNTDSCCPIGIVVAANQADKSGCNRVSAGLDRYRFPEQALHFIERWSWHRVPRPQFLARDLLRPGVLQKEVSDRPILRASIPVRPVAPPRDR